jgi:type VI protein secretion system component VasK
MSRQEGWMRRTEYLIVAVAAVLLVLGWIYSRLAAT